MAKFTSRADLLIAAGESIKMQMNAGVNEPAVKYMGKITACDELNYTNPQLCEYEFPLAVVEGKPVFVGDELYCNDIKVIINYCDKGFMLSNLSWNPPKPKTVMVELLRDDVEFYSNQYGMMSASQSRLVSACSKALEKA